MGIEKLVNISARKPWITLFIWLLFLALSGFLISRFLASALTTEQSTSSTTESEKASQLLEERLGREPKVTELVIIRSERYRVADKDFQDFTTSIQKSLENLSSEVEAVVSFYQTQNPAFVSRNQDATYLVITMRGDRVEAQENVEKIEEVVDQANGNLDFYVYNFGTSSINRDFQEIAEEDLQKGEIFGIPIALLVLIVVFGAIAAALLPVILSLLAIAIALGVVALVGQSFSLSFFVTNMITMMGLAVGIDYTLFIISRFREERAAGLEKVAAIKMSGKTAGRAIFFSGITVVLSLAGLLLVPSNIFRSLSIGAIIVVVISVVSALTLLPALLSLAGDRINSFRISVFGNVAKSEGKGFWNTLTGWVMKYPWISLELSAGILILAAMPLLSLHIGSSGVSTLPEDLPSREGFEILRRDFSAGGTTPTQIVVDADPDSDAVKKALTILEARLRSNPLIAAVQVETHPEEDITLISVPISASSDKETRTIERIRTEYVPDSFASTQAKVYVGGASARQLDFTNIVRTYMPIVFAFVLGLSFLLLTVVFRSLVVPAKAILMNLLSVGAAYGVLVLVIQKGFGNEIFGFQQTPQIESWIPIFLFAILFGLSMDYHVFLLSRIKERFDKTLNNDEAVAFGLSSTARLITGAALIMVAVFSAFAAGDLVMFQQVGFGLAVAILLDATVVRSILVPASMKLLGDRNWYLPSWLSWLPKIGVEG